MIARHARPGARRRLLLRYSAISIVLIVCLAFQSFSFFRLQRFSLQQSTALSSLRNLTLTDVASAGRDLYSAATSKRSDTAAPGFTIVDVGQTAAHVAAIDALSNPSARQARTNPLGNLTSFSRLRDQYFDVATNYAGPRLAVKEGWSGVRDVVIVGDNAPVKPFATGVAEAADFLKSPGDLAIFGRDGYVYNNKKSAKRSGYRLIRPKEMHENRLANLARLPSLCRAEAAARPRPWLIEFRNVWMTGSGEILVPVGDARKTNEWDVMAFQIQGGVCSEKWPYRKRKRIRFSGSQRQCETKTKLAFSISQNHGSSYFHVTHEVLPRLLTFWEVAMGVIATPGGRIAGPVDQSVVRNLLRSVGVPDEKLLLIGQNQPCFFEKLFVPAPVLQDYYPRSCLERTVGQLIGANAAAREQGDAAAGSLPLVVLIERATGRKNGRCRGVRCMKNFVQLRDALQREFGGRIELQTLSARDPNVMQRGIELFRRATVVVGVHGAGMNNVMFMKGKGTYLVHLGWKVAWQIYGIMSRQFNVDFVNIVTEGASQSGDNAVADIPVVVLQVRRSLLQEGFTLDPPKMKTSAWRNALVSMRMPKNKVEDLQTKLARWNPFT